MITFPNAKINLGLNIVSKRDDGYHNLETVFYPIPLRDALEIVPSEDGTHLTQSGLRIDGEPSDNLVMKAYRLLQKDYPEVPPLHIYLRKNIPFGAGLGGGSADASFLLKMMNETAGLALSNEQLKAYAAQLGADCPFFIDNQPVFAEGTGNVFSPVSLSLEGYSLLLIKPDIYISTREAFSGITPRKPAVSVKEIIASPPEDWKEQLVNDFEAPLFLLYPEIKQIKERLYAQGAVYAAMSGSGSSVFGLFRQPAALLPKIPGGTTFRLSL